MLMEIVWIVGELEGPTAAPDAGRRAPQPAEGFETPERIEVRVYRGEGGAMLICAGDVELWPLDRVQRL